MSSENPLSSYQRDFKEFLLTKENIPPNFLLDAIAVPSVNGKAAVKRERFVETRLNIYKNNVLYSLSEALASLYPVTKRIVGDDFFKMIAKEYVIEHPPLDPVIAFYGEFFAEFIAKTDSCRQLPYLEDVVLLEWQSQCSLHAADAEIFDPASLVNLDEEALNNLKFFLHPSATLMDSAFPIDKIWQENQKVEVGLVEIDVKQKSHLLIYRKSLQVQVVTLQPTVYYLLSSLAAGKAISEAWQYAKNSAGEQALADEEFSNILAYLLGLSIFVNREGTGH